MISTYLTGLSHLGLPVTDIERSRAFYRALGFEEVMQTDLRAGDESVHVCMMSMGGFILEMYQLVGEEGAEIARRGDGHIDHVALDVSDIDASFSAVRAMGLETLQDAPVYLPFWERGIRYFIFRGPDGEKIEFCQRLPA
ncbi:MAG: VOC family protein [Chloroflexi bacterium]|nr:VOC family protein [Chloroflexota bacterium]